MCLPVLREALAELGVGGGNWVDQFTSGFPFIGAVPEGSVYHLTQENSLPIPDSELLDTAPEGRKARMSSRKSPRDSELWEGALLQVKKGWLEGPFSSFRGMQTALYFGGAFPR